MGSKDFKSEVESGSENLIRTLIVIIIPQSFTINQALTYMSALIFQNVGSNMEYSNGN